MIFLKKSNLLKDNKELLLYAENEMNKARAELPPVESIVDEVVRIKGNVLVFKSLADTLGIALGKESLHGSRVLKVDVVTTGDK